jgi:hypothetical protein
MGSYVTGAGGRCPPHRRAAVFSRNRKLGRYVLAPRHPRPPPSPAYLAVCRPIESEANRAWIEPATPPHRAVRRPAATNREAASPASVIATTMTSTCAATLITGSSGSSSEPSSIIGPRFAAYRSDRAIGTPNHSTTTAPRTSRTTSARDADGRALARRHATTAPAHHPRPPTIAAASKVPYSRSGRCRRTEIDAVAAEQQTNEAAEDGADRGDERPRAWGHVRQSRAGRTAGEAILRIRHRHATQSLHLRDVNGRIVIRQTRPPT